MWLSCKLVRFHYNFFNHFCDPSLNHKVWPLRRKRNMPEFHGRISADQERSGVGESYYHEDNLFGLQLNLSANSNGSFSARNTVFADGSDDILAVDDLLADFQAGLFAYKESRNIVLVGMYIPLFVLATFNNLLVVTMVFRYRRFHSATNYLLVNLSLADLLVTLICIPMAVGTNVYRRWIFGNLICKVATYMEGVAVAASVFTLTAMSVDRYVAIRHPMTFRKTFNRTLALKVVAGVWLISFALFVPVLIVRRTEGFFVTAPEPRFRFVFCVEKWSDEDHRRIYAALLFAVVYAIPGHVIVAAYSMMGCTLRADRHHRRSHSIYSCTQASFKLIKGRRKVARIMLVLALTFAFCWLPYNIVMLILETSTDHDVRRYCLDVLPFALLVGHSNSAINPILYCFLAKSFRLGMRDTLRPCCRWKTSTTHRAAPSTMSAAVGRNLKYNQRSRSDEVSVNSGCFSNCFAVSNDDTRDQVAGIENSISSCCGIDSSRSTASRKRRFGGGSGGNSAVLVVVTNVAVSAVVSSSSDVDGVKTTAFGHACEIELSTYHNGRSTNVVRPR